MTEQLTSYPLDTSLLTECVDVSAGIVVRARVGLSNEAYEYAPDRLDEEIEVVTAQQQERMRRDSLAQTMASTVFMAEA